MKIDNRGQSLVMFVVIVPLLLLVLAMVVDIGNLVNNKIEINSVNKLAISYGIDNIDKDNIENEVKDIINKNYKDIDDIKISIQDEKISIDLKCYSKSIFGNIIGTKGYLIESSYKAYMDSDKKRIEKVK